MSQTVRDRTIQQGWREESIRSTANLPVLGAQLAMHWAYLRDGAPSHALVWIILFGVLAWTSPTVLVPIVTGAATAAILGLLIFASHWIRRRGLRAQLACLAAGYAAALLPPFALGAWILPEAVPVQKLVLALTMASAISWTLMTVRQIPLAPTVAVLILGPIFIAALGQLGSWQAWLAGGIVAAVSAGLARIAEQTSAGMAANILRERQLEETSHTVQLLLSEFEEQGSDWLFSIDAHGRLRQPNQRFAYAAGLSARQLEGLALTALFNKGPEQEMLSDALREGRAFRRMIVPLSVKGELRYWALTGRPIQEGSGTTFRGLISDVTAEKQAEAHIHRMAHHDPLTDLPNRLMFQECAEPTVAAAAPLSRCGLMFIDLDRFKAVNDLHGHRAGDALLKETARRLQGVAQSTEGLVARLGGDEFAILVPHGASAEGMNRLAEQVAVEVSKVVQADRISLQTSVSIGMSIAPDDAKTFDELLHHADLALYAAKQAGRNCWRRFVPAMNAAARQRREIDEEMKGALKRREFQLYYQPIVDARTLELRGFETLVRWIHPQRGFISPGDFIPIAEESGFIRDLGAWILQTAIEEAARWPEHLNVAVNVSPAQLQGDGVEHMVEEALRRSGLIASRLELEITESVLLEESGASRKMLKRLRNRGVRFSLDDFGTGFSSLSYLRAFPFHKIKIDRSFVSDMHEGGSCLAIIKAVLALARDMGMVSVAEGIEVPGQLAALQQMGCNQIQGFLIGKPLPLDKVRELVDQVRRDGSVKARVA